MTEVQVDSFFGGEWGGGQVPPIIPQRRPWSFNVSIILPIYTLSAQGLWCGQGRSYAPYGTTTLSSDGRRTCISLTLMRHCPNPITPPETGRYFLRDEKETFGAPEKKTMALHDAYDAPGIAQCADWHSSLVWRVRSLGLAKKHATDTPILNNPINRQPFRYLDRVFCDLFIAAHCRPMLYC